MLIKNINVPSVILKWNQKLNVPSPRQRLLFDMAISKFLKRVCVFFLNKIKLLFNFLLFSILFKTFSKSMRGPGVEPGSAAWKATMLTATPSTLVYFLNKNFEFIKGIAYYIDIAIKS